jgi:hypothetical protein
MATTVVEGATSVTGRSVLARLSLRSDENATNPKQRSTLASRRAIKAAVKAAVATALEAQKVEHVRELGEVIAGAQKVEHIATRKAFALETAEQALDDTRLCLYKSEAMAKIKISDATASLAAAEGVIAKLRADLAAAAAREVALKRHLAIVCSEIAGVHANALLSASVKERGERQIMGGEDQRSREVEMQHLERELEAARVAAAGAAARRQKSISDEAALTAAAIAVNAGSLSHSRGASEALASAAGPTATIDELFFAEPSPSRAPRRRAHTAALTGRSVARDAVSACSRAALPVAARDSPQKALLVGFAKFPSPVERRRTSTGSTGWMPTGRFATGVGSAGGAELSSMIDASWLGRSLGGLFGGSSASAAPPRDATFASPAKPIACTIPFGRQRASSCESPVWNPGASPSGSVIRMRSFAAALEEAGVESTDAVPLASQRAPPTRRRRHSTGSPPRRERTRSTLTTTAAGAHLLAESALHCLATPAAWAAMPSAAPLRTLLGETFALVERAASVQGAGAMVPRWVCDDDPAAVTCKGCTASFSVVNRRHHCRSCGDVFCGGCSAKRMDLAWEPNARVCDLCFTLSVRANV